MTKGSHAVVVSTVIDRSPAEVWADVRNIESHVTWMQDDAAIRFLSEGTGEFTLTEISPGQTEFRWEEDLLFPWFLGGRIEQHSGAAA